MDATIPGQIIKLQIILHKILDLLFMSASPHLNYYYYYYYYYYDG